MRTMKHFSWTILTICFLEAVFWFHCTVASSSEVEEYLIRENQNLKSPLSGSKDGNTDGINVDPTNLSSPKTDATKEEQKASSSGVLSFISNLLVVVGSALLVKRLFFNNHQEFSKIHASKRDPAKEEEGRRAFQKKFVGEEIADVIIVGCGIAGSALGVAFGKQGRKVLVLERDLNEPDRIVGELLQPGGMRALRKLGLQDCVKGIDSPQVDGYCVISDGRAIQLPYPQVDPDGPTTGQSFHHGRFIQNLREATRKTENVDLRQATVLKLLREKNQPDGKVIGVEFRVNRDEVKRAYAPLTVVCDGCFSKFRKDFVSTPPVAESNFVGVVMEGCKLPYPNHGHVFLVEPSPVLAYQIGSNETRVLVDIPNPMPSASNGDLKKYLQEKTAPQLPEGSVRECFLQALDNDRIRSMPNSKLHPQPFLQSGVLMLGDAYNMRHPLTGGGMTVAFADVVVVDDEFKGVDIYDEAQVLAAVKRWHVNRKQLSSTVNILSFALYNLFAANAKYPELAPMREACFAYFHMGGECANGPMNLLSVMKAKPHILMGHFFAVAFYGMYRTLYPFPTPGRVWTAYKIINAACRLFLPLCWGEHLFSLRYPVF